MNKIENVSYFKRVYVYLYEYYIGSTFPQKSQCLSEKVRTSRFQKGVFYTSKVSKCLRWCVRRKRNNLYCVCFRMGKKMIIFEIPVMNAFEFDMFTLSNKLWPFLLLNSRIYYIKYFLQSILFEIADRREPFMFMRLWLLCY